MIYWEKVTNPAISADIAEKHNWIVYSGECFKNLNVCKMNTLLVGLLAFKVLHVLSSQIVVFFLFFLPSIAHVQRNRLVTGQSSTHSFSPASSPVTSLDWHLSFCIWTDFNSLRRGYRWFISAESTLQSAVFVFCSSLIAASLSLSSLTLDVLLRSFLTSFLLF